MKRYLAPAFRIATALTLLYIIYHQKNELVSIKIGTSLAKHQRDSLIIVCDSLRSEMFVKDINISRYEFIMDRATGELNPECKEQIEKIVNETE